MKINKWLITLTGILVVGIFILNSCEKEDHAELISPDGNIRVNFVLTGGKPSFVVHFNNRGIVDTSMLGLNLKDGVDFSEGLEWTGVEKRRVDETWKPVWGIHERYRNNYREMTVNLRQTSNPERVLSIVFRAYNEGIAFRYHIPDQTGMKNFVLISEETTFNLLDDHECYVHLSSRPGFFQRQWEKRQVSELPADSVISLPMLLKTNSGWLALLEADLTNYAGMSLQALWDGTGSLVSMLDTTGKYKDRVPVTGNTPFDTPWRVLMMAENPGKFIESPILYNLNDPCEMEDVSWIKPGKVTWPWWNDRIVIENDNLKVSKADAPHGISTGEPTTEVMKHYTDFAARHDIPYLLLCAGWYGLEKDVWQKPWEEDFLTIEETRVGKYDIHEVIDYADQQDVDILLWVHLGSILTKGKIDTFLNAVSEWGVKGIKPDFYEGEDQELINHFHYLLEEAAKRQILVDYHGSHKPTGEMRTYPHYITNEAVHGLEYSKWGNTPEPYHNVIIPFTRMLCGPMDYTPGAFDLDGLRDFPKNVQTTRAQQLAMYAVYFTPLQMLVDYPYAYESDPDAFEFLKQVPTSWDETKFISGYPGEYIVVARRKGADWFVGVMNNDKPDRNIHFTFDFLDGDKAYTAHIYKDAGDADENPEHVAVSEMPVSQGDKHSVTLVSAGGEAIWLEAKTP